MIAASEKVAVVSVTEERPQEVISIIDDREVLARDMPPKPVPNTLESVGDSHES